MDKNKGNILIGQALGYTWHPAHTLNGISGVLKKEGRSSVHLDYNQPFHAEYYESWDALMPAVEYIESIEDPHHGHFGVHIVSNTCTIQATKLRTDQPMAEPPHYFAEWHGDTKIEATWVAVTQFFKWYNVPLAIEHPLPIKN